MRKCILLERGIWNLKTFDMKRDSFFNRYAESVQRLNRLHEPVDLNSECLCRKYAEVWWATWFLLFQVCSNGIETDSILMHNNFLRKFEEERRIEYFLSDMLNRCESIHFWYKMPFQYV